VHFCTARSSASKITVPFVKIFDYRWGIQQPIITAGSGQPSAEAFSGIWAAARDFSIVTFFLLAVATLVVQATSVILCRPCEFACVPHDPTKTGREVYEYSQPPSPPPTLRNVPRRFFIGFHSCFKRMESSSATHLCNAQSLTNNPKAVNSGACIHLSLKFAGFF
jgi:hypothetical protein